MNKKVFSWSMYDFANSVFFTTVVSGFFPIFFKKYWSSESSVSESTERLGLILAVAGFTLALLSPLLGVISDNRKSKKKFLFIFMLIGAVANASLFFIPQGDWLMAALAYGLAFFCCSASCVFYDALMSSVTQPENYDKVSSMGYAFGYLGGAILLIVNALMYQNPSLFGFASGAEGVKFSFLTVSIWWFIFTLPLMIYVKEPDVLESNFHVVQLLVKSIKELNRTLLDLIKNKNIMYFILAYWFYIDGISTIQTMAVDFGVSLGFEAGDLIKALLLTQLVGFPAAFFAGHLASKFGRKAVIAGCLSTYIIVVIGASVMTSPIHFYLMAFLIGLSMGGTQALSRSLFAYITPPEKSGEYFGFFGLLGKFASVVGPLLMAGSARLFGHPQKTILSLLILFGFGLFFLAKVKVNKEEV